MGPVRNGESKTLFSYFFGFTPMRYGGGDRGMYRDLQKKAVSSSQQQQQRIERWLVYW